MRMADKRSGTGRSAVMAMGQVVGLRGHSGRPPPDHQRQLLSTQPDLTHSAMSCRSPLHFSCGSSGLVYGETLR